MNDISIELNAKKTHQKAVNYYQISEQYGYKFLMEVKKIRDEKLYKYLGFKDFESYTLEIFGYTRETITNRISTAESWGDDYDEALRHYGKTKTNQIAQLPDKEREEVVSKGIPTDDGVKPVEEATTREIEKYKKQLKEKDERIANLSETVKEMANQKPEVIEKVVTKEVIPPKYENLESDNQQLTEALKEARERELKAKQEKERIEKEILTRRKIENDDMEQAQLTRLQRSADINVHRLILNMNDFVKEQSITVYDSEAIAGSSDETKQKLNQSIKRVENLLKDIKQEIGGNVVWTIN